MFLHSISTICQSAEYILELCICFQIRINQLLIFTEKFSPLSVPSRYASNWAILAWMRPNSLIIIFLVFQVITASEFHPRECSLFVYSSSKGTIRLCDMRQAALCDSHAKCKLPLTILSAILIRRLSREMWVARFLSAISIMRQAELCDSHEKCKLPLTIFKYNFGEM